MYEEQVSVIEAILNKFEAELLKAHSYIINESKAAGTGLEYYGILRTATNQAHKSGLIPNNFKQQVKAIDAAVNIIFTS